MAIQQYDPRTYGVRGDGITDCTRGIQLLINEIHNDGGGTLEITEPGTYIISRATATSGEFADNTALNSALVIYKNMKVLLGRGVTLKLFRGSNCAMIRNAGALVSTSNPDTGIEIEGGTLDYGSSNVFAEDFTSNASGTTVTKTGAFADYVWRQGDTFRYRLLDNSGFGSIAVIAKNSDNQITLGSQLPSALRNITTLYGVVNQQEQIISSDVTQANLGYGIFLKNVRGCSVRNVKVQHSLKFGVYACDVYECLFENIDGYNPCGGADIFHINGPAANLTVKNISGFSNDNMVGLIMGEGAYGNGYVFTTATHTTITYNATNKTLTLGTGTWPGLIAGTRIRLTSGTDVTAGERQAATYVSGAGTATITLSAKLRKNGDTADVADGGTDIQGIVEGLYSYLGNEGDISDVFVDGIHARSDTKSFEPFRIAGPRGTTAANIVARNITGDISSGSAVSLLEDSPYGLDGWVGRGIVIENVSCRLIKQNAAFSTTSNTTILLKAANLKDVTLRNIQHNHDNAAAYGIEVASGYSVETLFIDGFSNNKAFTGAGITPFILVAGSVGQLFARNGRVRTSSNGSVLNISGTDTTVTAFFENIDWQGTDGTTSYPFIHQSTGACNLTITNSNFDSNDATGGTWDSYLFRNNSTGLLTLTLGNVRFNRVYCLLQHSNAGAQTIVLGSGGITYSNIANYVLNTTGPTLFRVRNPDFKMLGERTVGTQVKGDVFDNTSTAGSGGSPSTNWGTVAVGQVIYNGTAWERWGRTA
jgi:hypothetical protein